VLIGAGSSLQIQRHDPLGGLLIGLGVILWGLDGVETGEWRMPRAPQGWITHFGWSARLRGAATALLGSTVATAGAMELSRPGGWEQFVGEPAGKGIFVRGVGLMGVLKSRILLVSRLEGVESRALRYVLTLLVRFLGMILLLVSGATIVVGILRLTTPHSLEGIGRLVFSWLASRQ
jgi:hypothetical protein